MGSEQHPMIPVLDFTMEDLKPGSDSWLERCTSVRQALEKHGCFVAVYDEVCDELENGVFCSMKELFDLSPETKQRNTYEGSPLKGYVGQLPQIPLHQSMGIDDGTTLEGIQSFTHKMWPKGNRHFCDTRNPFVEYAVQYSVAAAYATFDQSKKEVLHKLLLQGLDITILGSNDFYSYRNEIERRGLSLTPESLASLPPFSSITFNADSADGGNCNDLIARITNNPNFAF